MIYTIIVKNDSGEIEKLISFDSITSFNENLSAQICKNPVEKDFVISDHIVLDNIKYEISGVVSAYSVFDEGLELTWNGSQFVTQSTGNSTGVSDRHIRIENDIKSLILDRKIFSLLRSTGNSFLTDDQEKVTELEKTQVELIENCAITSLSFAQNAGSSSAVFPQMSIEKVQVAVTQTETLAEDEQKPLLKKVPRQLGQAKAESTKDNGDGVSTNETASDKSTVGSTARSAEEQQRLNRDNANANTIDKHLIETAIQQRKNFELARINDAL